MLVRAVKRLRLEKKYDIIYVVCVGFCVISRETFIKVSVKN